ncbi:S-layer homology domain-containing protein [Desulfofundulus thermosubterraneus]|uniref:S-layer homology domain-containing protein n=1 Tax=Desulfofundulus thermosubterraneus DSM 16057 TaxID=1121432 RepID=A0A1M6EHD3_9FIRM|nr:S-layer homology domain-containing protein [Desulfofundulus thermosubterraneus]SHI84843.1 S-layer homology domain-containing protein [Desulfofundulus thermosubterraneus DSM 16057]
MYHHKRTVKKLSLLLVLVMAATLLTPAVNAGASGVSGSPANNAVQFLYNEYIQKGINNSEYGVGSYALYVLKQAGVDVASWVYNGENLNDAVINAVYNDISQPDNVPAKILAQDLLAMQALGRSDLADQLVEILKNRQTENGFDTGAYSLFSNLPAFDLLGRAGLMSVVKLVYAKEYILSQQLTVNEEVYGSWGGSWTDDKGNTNYFADFMATAQAVRALHYLDPGGQDARVQAAINNGLNWMRNQQKADGSFVAGWDDPAIDTAEVVVTLKALERDPADWKTSDGKTAVDYLMNNVLNPDGSFGTSKNAMDAIWVLSACNSLGIQPTVWRLYLDPPSNTLNIGAQQQFRAVWQDAYGQSDVTQWATWSVADSSIASVDDSVYGLVKAIKAGQTVVKAVYNGLTAAATLTVQSAAGGGGTATAVTVGMAVVGLNGELLYGPSYVMVPKENKWGLTALGALDASGVPYHTSTWSWGILVDEIAGQANSGMAGWMYTVNGQVPSFGPEKYNIKEGDKIIWYYSKSMDQQPPKWDDLVKQASGGSNQAANLPAPVSDSTLKAAIEDAGSAGRVVLQAEDNQTVLALTVDQLAKITGVNKPLAVTVQGVQFVLSVDSLKVPELKVADAAQLQVKVQKLSSTEAQDLAKPVADKLKLVGDVYELDVLAVKKDGTVQKIAQLPDCRVLLPVPAEAREAAAGGRVKAYRYDESKKTWEEVGGTYDPAAGGLTFKADHFSKYALMETSAPPELKTFADIAGHWAQKEIEFMATKGYVAGVGDNKFAPEATVTRAEFATILARMAGLTAEPDGAKRFNDVPQNAWYCGMVGAAAKAGLVRGVGEHSFAPNEPITREQMAAMMVRLMAQKGQDMSIDEAGAARILAGFEDAASISPWARNSVALVVREQVMRGRALVRFIPAGQTTRAEATVVLYRVWQKLQPPAQNK